MNNLLAHATNNSVNTSASQIKELAPNTRSSLKRVKTLSPDVMLSALSTAQKLLIQLIQQHQQQTGWILLIAPKQLPDKMLAEYYQLPTQKILIVHEQKISDLGSTIGKALSATSCSVVIDCSGQLNATQLAEFHQTACRNNKCFYPLQQLQQSTKTH